MTLERLFSIVWRWRLLVAGVLGAVVITLLARSMFTPQDYQARVKLQFTAPEQEVVVLFDSFRSGNVRDELAIARNNFTELLDSREVVRQTRAELGLPETFQYQVSTTTVRDSDFLYVDIVTQDPNLAQVLAETHVRHTLNYFGVVRAQSVTAIKDLIAIELRQTTEQRIAAEDAFRAFRSQHDVAVLDRAQLNTQDLINALERSRDQQLIDRTASRVIERIDASIVQRRTDLERLIALEEEYNSLQIQVADLAEREAFLRSKYSEAELKETTIRSASFIQVVDGNDIDVDPVGGGDRALMLLGMIGGLGVGVMLAFAAEYLSGLNILSLSRRPSKSPNTSS